MKKEAAVVALGFVISGAIVLWSLSRPPKPLSTPVQTAQEPSPPPHAPWVEFFEVRPGCGYTHPQTLLWIATHRNDDGSCGNGPAQLEGRPLGKTGMTALSLLPFLGAGYATYSKDVFVHEGGDWHFGKEVTKSLQWLLRNQRPDGSFRSTADETFDQVLATFVLSDLCGMTLEPAWKEPAQRAVDALLRMQKPDGTWEGAGPTAWAIVALCSARLSELDVDASALDRALRASGYPGHPGEALARVLGKREANLAVARLEQESLERDSSNPSWWYLTSLAMWAHGGIPGDHWASYKPGPTWERWSTLVRGKLLRPFQEDGSIAGRSPDDAMVRTCLAQLTQEVYYRYSCVFRPH